MLKNTEAAPKQSPEIERINELLKVSDDVDLTFSVSFRFRTNSSRFRAAKKKSKFKLEFKI